MGAAYALVEALVGAAYALVAALAGALYPLEYLVRDALWLVGPAETTATRTATHTATLCGRERFVLQLWTSHRAVAYLERAKILTDECYPF